MLENTRNCFTCFVFKTNGPLCFCMECLWILLYCRQEQSANHDHSQDTLPITPKIWRFQQCWILVQLYNTMYNTPRYILYCSKPNFLQKIFLRHILDLVLALESSRLLTCGKSLFIVFLEIVCAVCCELSNERACALLFLQSSKSKTKFKQKKVRKKIQAT